MLINGFNSWCTGFGSGGTTFITAGMIINGAIFFEISQIYSGNSQKVSSKLPYEFRCETEFFQVFSVTDRFFLSTADRSSRRCKGWERIHGLAF